MTVINTPDAKFNKQFQATGILKLSPTIERLDYGVSNSKLVVFDSISDILDEIYSLEDKSISFRMNLLGSYNENPKSIVREGQLNLQTDKFDINSYHIGDFPLELYLDEQTEKTVSIHIGYNGLLDSEVVS